MQTGAPSIPDFELLRQVGRGAYGDVWLARSVTGIHRAVKIVYRDRFEEARPFEREFTGIQRFEPISRSRENLIDVLHVGRKDEWGFFYYVMELADAADGEAVPPTEPGRTTWVQQYRPRTLREVLATRKRLPVEDCLPIAIGLARALEHLHGNGLIHRDIKPSNVIFVNGTPKLADIGLVSAVEESRSFVGTEGFVPPEGPGTPSADLYSLGKVLYEMSTGRDRLEFPKLPDDLESIPRREALLEFNEVVLKACQSLLRERYTSASGMLDDLLLLQAGRSVKRLRLAERRLARVVPLGLAFAGIGLALLVVQHFETRQAKELARVEGNFRRQAEAQELATRQLLYAADMNLAHQAYVDGDLGRAKSLLASYAPKPGTPDLRGFEWHYYWAQSQGDQLYTFPTEPYAVAEVAFSPDGHTLAAAAYDFRGELWDVQTHQCLAKFPTERPVENVGFSPDGNQLAISDYSGHVQVRDIRDGHLIFSRDGVFCRMTTSPTRPWLALGSGGKQSVGDIEQVPATVWDYRANRQLFSLPGAGTYVAFSPDGRRLATGGGNHEINLWDLSDGRLLKQLSPVENNFGMSFSPDGNILAVGDELGFVQLWDLPSGRRLAGAQVHAGQIFKTAFSPDGKLLVSVSADQTVRLSDAKSLAPIRTLRGHNSEIWGVAFARDSRTLATCGKDGTIRLWDLQRPAANDVLTRHVSFWDWPVFSTDSRLLAVGDTQMGVLLCRLSDGAAAGSLADAKRPLAFVDNDRSLLTLGHHHELQRWQWTPTNVVLRNQVPLAITNAIRAHVYLADRAQLITGDERGEIHVWNCDSGVDLGCWRAHPDHITGLAISPDHTLLATTSQAENESKIWDLATRQLKWTLRGQKMFPFAAAFSPNGQTVAVASEDDTCGIWEVQTGELLVLLSGHKGGAYSVAFSPDGKTLAAGCNDNELKLWNVATRRDMMTLMAEPEVIFSTAFSPDGQVLATVSFDPHNDQCALKLWRAP